MAAKLPNHLVEKAATFPRMADGSVEVTLILKDGRKVFGAILADGRSLVSIDDAPVNRRDLDFGMTDIIDVLPGP